MKVVEICEIPLASAHVKVLPEKGPIESEPVQVAIGPASFKLPSAAESHWPLESSPTGAEERRRFGHAADDKV